MKSINLKKFVFVMTLSIIITHIFLAYHGLIENYEAFVCALGYIAIGVLISSMLPEQEEFEGKSWFESEDDRLVRKVMDQMLEEKLGYKKEKTLEETL